MTKVIKKGGKTQNFSPAKIKNSVTKAAKEAELTQSQIDMLMRSVAMPVIMLARKKKTVKTTNLRKSLLGRLGRRNKKVVKAWKNYDKNKK